VSERAAQVLACGGEVWVADETGLREFPPLRAGWARKGEQAAVVVSGRNARRTLHGALNVATGELVRTVTATCKTADVVAAVAAFGRVRPWVPKLLVWDNAPPHHPKRVREAAALAGVELAFLPFRAPELMPLEDVWRGTKGKVAANRCYATVDELAERAVAALDALAPGDLLRRAGLRSSKFQWLPT
jgi:transposase